MGQSPTLGISYERFIYNRTTAYRNEVSSQTEKFLEILQKFMLEVADNPKWWILLTILLTIYAALMQLNGEVHHDFRFYYSNKHKEDSFREDHNAATNFIININGIKSPRDHSSAAIFNA